VLVSPPLALRKTKIFAPLLLKSGCFLLLTLLRDLDGIMRSLRRSARGNSARSLRVGGEIFVFGLAGPVEAGDGPKHKAVSGVDGHLKLQEGVRTHIDINLLN
jgi:hypothetical protein